MRNNERTISVGYPLHAWNLSSRAAGSDDQEEGLSVPCILRLFVRPASNASSERKRRWRRHRDGIRDDTVTVRRISQRRWILVARSRFSLNVLLTVSMCACGAHARLY